MHDHQLIRTYLIELLSSSSPELGARLKHRLNTMCLKNGLGPFNERAYGCSKFTEYLLRVHGDILSVERQKGPGDLFVSLTGVASGSPPFAPSRPQSKANVQVRSDLWQAFSNPDPRRKRFLNLKTERVLHFLEHDENALQKEVEAAPGEFVEIRPVEEATQREWMKDYLSSIQLSPAEREALEALVGVPFTSQLNTTFTSALGEHSAGWKAFRLEKFVQRIEGWAHQTGLSRDKLFVSSSNNNISRSNAPTVSGGELTSRQQAIRMLELLSEEDIARLVLPTILASILVRSQAS